MGIVLFIAANLVAILVFPFAILVVLVQSMWHHHLGTGIKQVNKKFFTLAISFDKYGNVFCAELFNATLIKRHAHVRFGNINQTISAVIGWNLVQGTLTRTGRVLNWVLNKMERDHTLKAISKDQLTPDEITKPVL